MSRVLCQPLRRPGSEAPLFLIAAPEVNPLGYTALARALPPGETPVLVQPARTGAGPRTGEYDPAEIAALGRAYLDAVRARQPRGPYFLAGMCDGAHLAFEVARALAAVGEEVALLAMLDTWPVENSSRFALVLFEGLRRRLRRLRGGGLPGLRRALRAVVGGLGTPEHRRWRARVWPGEGFRPPVFPGRITVVRAAHQAYYRVRDPSLGWGAWSALPVDVHVVPGDHEHLLRRPSVVAVAGALDAALRRARAARVAEAA